ncbi:hypothetical protein M0812_20254 [Anaeramoeba flamelloides]|uniref:Uncharacterized protein n=1 Tax=Anaeramoeba flamelloides TaxID=1746091 RepID=A0AAV7YWQ7_9EUKA|nr:hypothetical protein M0812_20254 [Anaeramoeba flamelloides]
MKLLLLIFVLFSLSSILVVSNGPTPKYPDKYHIEFIFSLPPANLHHNYVVDYDQSSQKERVEIDNELAISLYRYDGDNNSLYDIIVTQDNQTCYENMEPHLSPYNDEENNLTDVLPDLSDWIPDGTQVKNGILCNVWKKNETHFERNNYYTFYSDVVNDNPVQYHMLGYDIVFESHYDEYIIDYYEYKPNEVDEEIFNLPEICNNPSDSQHHVFGRNVMKLHNLFPESSEKSDSKFDKFTSHFGKSYSSKKEQNYRQQIFNSNFKKIRIHNHQNSEYKMKLNRFADLTIDEFKSLYTMPTKTVEIVEEPSRKFWKSRNTLTSDLPTTFDWRDFDVVTRVKDQAVCGSCWAFSVIGAFEGQLALSKSELIELSEQNVIDCTWHTKVKSYGCDGSEQWKAYEGLMELGGVMGEADYPYMGVTGYCGYDDSKKLISIKEYKTITQTEEEVMKALYELGPLAVSYSVVESNVFYGGGYYEEDTCSKTDLNHAVLMVGWGNYNNDPTKPYWLIKNSWSEYWGDDGYMYVSRKDNTCGFCTGATSPVLERV